MCLLVWAAPATGQARPACAPEKTLAVKLTSEERALPAPLIATHDVSVAAEFTGTTEHETYAPPPGVTVLGTGRSGVDFIVPIAASVAITVSWQQAIDPSDPSSDASDPLTSCAAATVVTLPIVPARPEPRGEAARVDRRVAAGLLVVRRGAGPRAARPLTASDLGPHDLTRGLPAGDGRGADDGRADAHRRPDQVRQEAARPVPPRRGRALPALPADLRRRVQRGGPPVPRHRRPPARRREGRHQRRRQAAPPHPAEPRGRPLRRDDRGQAGSRPRGQAAPVRLRRTGAPVRPARRPGPRGRALRGAPARAGAGRAVPDRSAERELH